MREDRVQIEVDDHVAVVTLARPDKHNALDEAMFDGDRRGRRGGRRDARRARRGPPRRGPELLLGPRPRLAHDRADRRRRVLAHARGRPAREPRRSAPRTDWIDLPVPVVAALHGICSTAAGCSSRSAPTCGSRAPDARLSVMESKWGLVPDMGITSTLPRLVRADVAKELTYTGRIVSGEEAAALGLVDPRRRRPAGRRARARARDRRALARRGARRQAPLRRGLERARRGRPAARGRAADAR